MSKFKNVKVGDIAVFVDNTYSPSEDHNKAVVVDVFEQSEYQHIFVLFEDDPLLFKNNRGIEYSFSFSLEGIQVEFDDKVAIVDIIPA